MQAQLGRYATVRRWATDRRNVLKRACVPELWFSGVGSLVLEWIWGGWDLGPVVKMWEAQARQRVKIVRPRSLLETVNLKVA